MFAFIFSANLFSLKISDALLPMLSLSFWLLWKCPFGNFNNNFLSSKFCPKFGSKYCFLKQQTYFG